MRTVTVASAPSRFASTSSDQIVDQIIGQAGRLGIPIVLWRLVDAVIRGGALLDANNAAALFPPGQIAPPPDTPLDNPTAAVLRHVYTRLSSTLLLLFFFSRFSRFSVFSADAVRSVASVGTVRSVGLMR